MIYFIGGGFGSAEYLTVRASSILSKADVVLFSRLIDKEILKVCKKKCIFISLDSTEKSVNRLLKENRDKNTVYITDGDFSFFGDVQFYIDFCRERNIKFEIIPGISAVSASAAMLGQEMMLPNISQCAIVTYAEDNGLMIDKQKLSELAKHNATMFIYMARIEQFSYISKSLLEGGYREDTPVVIIRYLLRKDSKKIFTTVKEIVNITSDDYNGLAVLMVGDVFRDVNQRRELTKGLSVSTNFRFAENFNWKKKMGLR